MINKKFIILTNNSFSYREHQMKRTFILATTFAGLFATPVLAHPGHTVAGDLATGLMHPFLGLDHILAMLAVGLLAVQSGGKAKFALPALFVGVMIVGGYAGLSALNVPFVEQGILASVILLGVVIAAGGKLSLGISAPMVAAFALFHGAAHGMEMAVDTSAMAYGSGMIAASTLLHFAGMGVGQFAPHLLRYAGAAVAVAGFGLAVA